MAGSAEISAGTFGRLDVRKWQVHPEPPSTVDVSADRRALVLIGAGHVFAWTALAAYALLTVLALTASSSIPIGGQWSPMLWIGGFVGFPLGLLCIRVGEWVRRKTGHPVPFAVYDVVAKGIEAARNVNEMFEMIDAAERRPEFVERTHRANARQLRLIARHCEHAAREHRWHMPPLVLSYRHRYITKLTIPLHECAERTADRILQADPLDPPPDTDRE
ncbi:hypothetical protein [Haloactinomyces albus]|uniref:Uncharacterized protein n=1 Tax=Haloactinomyces albus TaxID=1352928 RepID=A0AAE4CND2_9ACTN|nr:hypothetical protein [Haloactinomyces albus]MDR7301917.1 hypothetical protein [Haloactinomyces albus]